ncbi:MAG: VWA domain-containing protein [Acidobacteria bacterium]|nr:VWA domain-containing protein [Acidobacteriota bacterium]
MKFVKFTKFLGDDFGISSEDLMRALSSFLLQSGYQDRRLDFSEMQQNNLETLQQAIRDALESGELFSEEQLEKMIDRLAEMTPEQYQQLIDTLTQKLVDDGYVSIGQPGEAQRKRVDQSGQGGQAGQDLSKQDVRFEVNDKALDFLGYKTLKDLLGSLGRSSFGSHDTREMATGVETSGSTKAYEFGDSLNLDVNATLSNAIQRQGLGDTIDLDYPDLMVRQSEYQSSCATVLMLDCSHSMILYGEDRFTPAKQVALALSHLIRTQYPGDSLHLVLFHDSAEELPLSKLARVQVGPFHTNTREGLIVAQRILRRQRKEMRQIIMITDGKPSALTLEDGRIYKNPFGLDPLVISRTLEEVHKCRRQGVMINTFMLAQDYALVQFIQKVAQICRGKAYFTSPYNLGEHLLMDYMNNKSRMVH